MYPTVPKASRGIQIGIAATACMVKNICTVPTSRAVLSFSDMAAAPSLPSSLSELSELQPGRDEVNIHPFQVLVGVPSRSTKATKGSGCPHSCHCCTTGGPETSVSVCRTVGRANRVASLVHVAVPLEQLLPTQLHGLVDQLMGLQRAGGDGGAVLACPAASVSNTVRTAPRLGSGSAGCPVPAVSVPRSGRNPAVSGTRRAGTCFLHTQCCACRCDRPAAQLGAPIPGQLEAAGHA